MSEHARLMAWKTRREKYGPKGHVGSYSRSRRIEKCSGLLDLVIRLHREGVVSEGQVARASGLDRVTVRTLVCDQADMDHGRVEMSELPKAEIGAVQRCDGMGEPADDGDYVLMRIEHDRERPRFFRVSLGQAALLIDELRGCLSASSKGRDVTKTDG